MNSASGSFSQSVSNTTTVNKSVTARTQEFVAMSRAFRLSRLDILEVIEACVGPSYEVLENAYAQHFITAHGVDIDPQWVRRGVMIGDALTFDYHGRFPDAHIVFAPPLSEGCTGQREDSLSINHVVPRYTEHLQNMLGHGQPFSTTLVLPGRTFSVKQDRSEFHQLMARIWTLSYSWDHVGITRMTDSRGRVVKYVEIDLFHGPNWSRT